MTSLYAVLLHEKFTGLIILPAFVICIYVNPQYLTQSQGSKVKSNCSPIHGVAVNFFVFVSLRCFRNQSKWTFQIYWKDLRTVLWKRFIIPIDTQNWHYFLFCTIGLLSLCKKSSIFVWKESQKISMKLVSRFEVHKAEISWKLCGGQKR